MFQALRFSSSKPLYIPLRPDYIFHFMANVTSSHILSGLQMDELTGMLKSRNLPAEEVHAS